MPILPSVRTALVHDWLTGMRGGEKCLEAFCEMFPGAPIYTLVAFPEKLSDRIRAHPIRTSFLQKLPFVELLGSAAGPDSYVELPFEWPESPARARNASKDVPPAPIVELMQKKPWLLARLYSGRTPHATG